MAASGRRLWLKFLPALLGALVLLAIVQIPLAVIDDGKGFESADVLGRETGSHFGLRLLSDLAAEAGGRLQLDAIPGRGTRVCVEVPVP